MSKQMITRPWLLIGLLAIGGAWQIGRLDAGTFPANTTTEAQLIQAKLQAAHFLSKATFGPNIAQINNLATRITQIGQKPACEEWLNQQFALPASLQFPLARQMVVANGYNIDSTAGGDADIDDQGRYRSYAWWTQAMSAPDQLRHRMAWALAQIWVVNDSASDIYNGEAFDAIVDTDKNFATIETTTKQPWWMGNSHYYDIFLRNAFGKYKDIATEVTYHPVMGIFLSHLRNQKANTTTGIFPDENYAREIMQLFTIGLLELNLDGTYILDTAGEAIPTYDNRTITELARVMTGLSYANTGATPNFTGSVTMNVRMRMTPSRHDFDVKDFRDKVRAGAGVLIPAYATAQQTEANGNADVNAALDMLVNHPNCAPFISRLLIQRLVKSNPTTSYIKRVATVFQNTRGQANHLKQVIKAILLDTECLKAQAYKIVQMPLSVTVSDGGTEYTRLREPIVQFTSMIRGLNGTANFPRSPGGNSWFMMTNNSAAMAQAPHGSPSVFNFYLPDFQVKELATITPSRFIPNARLYSPEFQIFTGLIANNYGNRIRADIYNNRLNGNPAAVPPTATTTVAVEDGIADPTVTRENAFVDLSFADLDAIIPNRTLAEFTKLVTHLDMLFAHGSLREVTKTSIITALNNERNRSGSSTLPRDYVEAAVLAVLNAPECWIDE